MTPTSRRPHIIRLAVFVAFLVVLFYLLAVKHVVNIEDVRIEHSPGLPVGVAELSVRPAEAGVLLDALEAGGWPVRR